MGTGTAEHTSPRLVLHQHGRFGNHLFEVMSSVYLAAALGAERIEGVSLEPLGITTGIDGPLEGFFEIPRGRQRYPVAQMLAASDASCPGVVNNGLGMHMAYIAGQRPFWQDRFDRLAVEIPAVAADEAVVVIRAGDIMSGGHRLYHPMPFAFIDAVMDDLGMRPLFVGEVAGDHPWLAELRSRYPGARFLHGRLLEDFELIRRSRVKVLAISTFAWMAGWLGPDDSQIVLPVAGLFNPDIYPAADFLPAADPRYEFRWCPPRPWLRDETDLDGFLAAFTAAAQGFPVVAPSALAGSRRPLSGAERAPATLLPASPEEWSALAGAVLGRRDAFL
jgi:hypothetical protein